MGTTDSYPAETSWTLTNTCNNQEQASRAAGDYSAPGTSYNEEECVPTASYTFEISDTYGDGLCCSYGSGSYKVTYNGVVEKEGGQFGSSESTTFGSCDSPAPVSPSPISSTPAPTVNEPAPVASPTSPIASPIASPVEGPNDWDTIFEEGFEVESDNFQNAGNRIVSNKYHTGASSARIRKKQKLVSAQKIISEYTDLKVDFYYYGQGMEDGESFILEIKMNGSGWTEVGRWTRGQDFE